MKKSKQLRAALAALLSFSMLLQPAFALGAEPLEGLQNADVGNEQQQTGGEAPSVEQQELQENQIEDRTGFETRAGNGDTQSPYLVNSSYTIGTAVAATGTYYVAVKNLGTTTISEYKTDTNGLGGVSYARVNFTTQSDYTVEYVVVLKGEVVRLDGTLVATEQSVISNGTLIVNANGNTVKGESIDAAQLTVRNGVTGTKINGSFAKVLGLATLSGATTIADGSPEIVGNDKNLAITGGSASVEGDFGTLAVGRGATVTVIGETTAITLTNNGTVTVNSGKKLEANGIAIETDNNSITFGAGNTEWGKLPTGSYETVSGAWTQTGDVIIQGTGGDEAKITSAAHALTVAGGNVTLLDDVGALSVTGGKLSVKKDTTAKSVSVSGGRLELSRNVTVGGTTTYEAATLCDGTRAITCPKDKNDAIVLTKWGELGAGAYSTALFGDWTLPAGADVTVTGAACGHATTGTHATHLLASVEGKGGTLTVASAHVSVKGAFDALTVNDTYTATVTVDTKVKNALTLTGEVTVAAGTALCDSTHSLKPKTETTVATWGKLPAGGNYDSVTGEWTIGGTQDDHIVTISSTGYDCGVTGHSTDDFATITGGTGNLTVLGGKVTLSGKISGTVSNVGGEVTDNGNNQVTGDGKGVTEGTGTTQVHAKDNETVYIRGTFANVTGNVVLAGETTINNTKTAAAADSSATVTGDGYALTVNAGAVSVKEKFERITTTGDLHVTLAADTVIESSRAIADADKVGVTGNALYTLTMGKAGAPDANLTAHVKGEFKQITVDSGTVTDCAEGLDPLNPIAPVYNNIIIKNTATCLIVNGGMVTLDNGGTIAATASASVDAVQVNGGKLTIGGARTATTNNIYKISASASNATNGNNGISVSGGECYLFDGTVNVSGQTGNGVRVHGTGAKFHLGADNNTKVYSDLNNPKITVTGAEASCVNTNAGGETWLHAGELHFTDKDSYGVFVSSDNGTSGICHVHPNNDTGSVAVNNTLLYIHGENSAKAAMWVGYEGKYDIRGRGVLFEEPSDYGTEQYALYIHNKAIPASEYPLSGGTFDGDVRYVQGDISSLLPYNHYLRYDGAAANYSFTDGTYGVRPHSMTTEADLYGTSTEMHVEFTAMPGLAKDEGKYKEYFGKNGEFYSITDAEWELRRQMATVNGSYQIPAGIVRGGASGAANVITLDANVFAADTAAYRPYWGIDAEQSDVDVIGAGHTLFLAGRTVRYDGKNRAGDTLAGENAEDARQTVDVNSGADLLLRDSTALNRVPRETVQPDPGKHFGGYIGTGTIRYDRVDQVNDTRALYNSGETNVMSAKLTATASDMSDGLYNKTGTSNIGTVETEDRSNETIYINGSTSAATGHGIYVESGTVNVYGGQVNGQIGLETAGGVSNVIGGIVSGAGDARVAVKSSGGSTYVTGGALYGAYADDSDAGASGTSVLVTGGTTSLKIDEANKAYAETVIPFTGDNAYKTSDKHHICDVKVEGGDLIVGATMDLDDPTAGDKTQITNFTRNNGDMTLNGGKTVFYDGIVIGDTQVFGAARNAANTPFGTKLYINDGDFAGLSVKDSTTGSSYYALKPAITASALSSFVQLHGGRYKSLDVSGLSTASGSSSHGATVNDIVGFWTNAKDLNGDTTADWVQYNHYVTLDKSARDKVGYWAKKDGSTINEDRFMQDGLTVGKADSMVVVRNGAQEFANWLESNASGYDGRNNDTYKLRVNIWIPDADSKLCETYFHDGIAKNAPLIVGQGLHKVDMNNRAIAGDAATNLITIPESATLTMTNSNTDTVKPESNRVYNLNTTAGTALDITDGKLNVTVAQDNTNVLSVQARNKAVTATNGAFTLDAGNLVAKGSDADSKALQLKGTATATMNNGTVTGQAVGATVADTASFTVKNGTVVGEKLQGIVVGAGKLAVFGKDTKILGETKGIDVSGETANVTVSDSTVTGTKAEGIALAAGKLTVSGKDAKILGATKGINVSGMTADVAISDGAVTGTAAEGIAITSGKLTISGKDTAVTGATDGIAITGAAEASVSGGTIKGANGVSVAGSGKLTASGSTATLEGTANGVSQTGGTVAISGKVLVKGNINGLHKTAGDTALTGGVYSSIKTELLNEKLAALLGENTKVRDQAVEDTRDTVSASKTVAPYALENNAELKASSYEVDENHMSETYATLFLLSTASSGGGGGGGGGIASYTVTYEAGEGGTLKGDAKETVISGSLPKHVPTPVADAGKTFKGWSIDGKTLVNPAETKITKSTTFTALFTDGLIKTDHFAYIQGDAVGTFRPESSLTRAETASMFYRLMADKSTGHTVSFADVKRGDWYYDAVSTLAERGIIKGDANGFRPQDTITRAEFAAICARFSGIKDGDVSFTDVSASHWAYQAIATMSRMGYMNGYSDGTFGVSRPITRAESVKVINNLLDRTADTSYISEHLDEIKTYPDVAASHWAYEAIIEASNAHDYTNEAGSESWTALR